MIMRPTFAPDSVITATISERLLNAGTFSIEEINAKEAYIIETSTQDNHYKIILLTQGDCYCNLGPVNLHMSASNIGIIRPKQACTMLVDEGTTGFLLSFSYDYLQLIAGTPGIILPNLHAGLSEYYTISATTVERVPITEIALQIAEEHRSFSSLREEMIRSLFRVFILYVCRLNKVKGDIDYNRCPPLVKRFFTLLENYFLTLKMPADYADLLAVTPAYLNELVKRSCGFTTSYCIQQRIVAEAKRLIMNSELSLKEISYRLGFDDASHFSKFFKKFTGKRYSDFRRQIIN
ncbi:Helix-turn-helix domain-containing protein [Chitinophaga sp. YR627]|uniref:helix-turn-helix domain-containing protein n=1 Tax=Chitinophaga sp. YR627 TaxID=1881041 RepID=UPI0008F0301A|nr:helix-turn-helix domain-containing protein [Chitinophaga sp. YR627]SFN30169.1 Helix-turn-helix domain-containing protein [Chitinophaga sp. YR627]